MGLLPAVETLATVETLAACRVLAPGDERVSWEIGLCPFWECVFL